MGSVLSQSEYQTHLSDQLLFREMSGEELILAYGMSKTKCDKEKLAAFFQAIHTNEIDRQIELALLGGTVRPAVNRCGSLKEKHE
jgi:hypothetical protein